MFGKEKRYGEEGGRYGEGGGQNERGSGEGSEGIKQINSYSRITHTHITQTLATVPPIRDERCLQL